MSETMMPPRLRSNPGGLSLRPPPRLARLSEVGAVSKATLLEHRVLLVSITGLCLLGLPIVLSASAVSSLTGGSSAYSLFLKQAAFMAIGTLAAVVASHVSMGVVRKSRVILPLGALALLFAVYLPGVGHVAGGSSRWIGAGPIQLQPSELMKLAMVVFAADLLARRAGRPDVGKAVVQPLMILLGVAGIMIVKQPDLGTSIVITCIAFSLMFAAGVPGRMLASTGGLVALAGAYLALGAAYRRDRLLSFLHPFAHASSSGYQVAQGLVALGQGSLRGSGIGASAATWGYLPNAHTDFVFAVLGGNLGVAGSLAVIAGFGCFAWAGFRVASREKDPFTRYVAIGITCWVVAQAVINIGGVIDVLPVTGIPLPFISYGGSALVVTMTAAGLLLGIARRQAVR